MGRYFHVDRRKDKLRPGYVMGLEPMKIARGELDPEVANRIYPAGLSRFGLVYLGGFVPSKQGVLAEREIRLEAVRRLHYPGRPSRFASVFACETESDARLLIAKLGGEDAAIWEVDCADSFAGDMTILEVKSLSDLAVAAHRYWSGESGDAAFIEHLLSPPVTVIRRVER